MEEIWRTKGKLALPELLNDFSDEETTPYLALTAAKDLTLSSLRRGNSELASRSFSYAEWCRLQKDEDVRNAAYVCFYEYIFEDDSLETKVAGYIPKSLNQNS